MLKKEKFFIYAAFFSFLTISGLFADPGWCEVRLAAPRDAGIGNAFVAEASSDFPVRDMVFIWRGKRYQAMAAPLSDGRYHAKILLPVPLDEKASLLELQVIDGKGAPARANIKVAAVSRPVQKLNVDRKYVTPPPEVTKRIETDREKVRKALRDRVSGRHWDIPLLRPVAGSVSSQFGLKRVFNGQPRGMHKGLDLRGAQGTPIRACADGKVALVDDLYYSGNTVYINHGEGVFTAYLHMSATDVKPGEMVRRGQIIGRVGATGRVTGPHLHLSVFAQGESVDPLPLLQKTSGADSQPVAATVSRESKK